MSHLCQGPPILLSNRSFCRDRAGAIFWAQREELLLHSMLSSVPIVGSTRGLEMIRKQGVVEIYETHPKFLWKLHGEDVLIPMKAQRICTFLSEDRVLVISSAFVRFCGTCKLTRLFKQLCSLSARRTSLRGTTWFLNKAFKSPVAEVGLMSLKMSLAEDLSFTGVGWSGRSMKVCFLNVKKICTSSPAFPA